MQVVWCSEGYKILFYAKATYFFISDYLVNKIYLFNKTICMSKKSSELLSIERKIKKHLKVSSEGYLSSKNTKTKTFYAGAYTSLTLLLEDINKKK